jgi:hypothetical protein
MSLAAGSVVGFAVPAAADSPSTCNFADAAPALRPDT